MPTIVAIVPTNAINSVIKTNVERLSEWYRTRALNKAILGIKHD
ncbi:MAG TPA: hypothetical protein VKY31_14745 [Terriglobia bacterium]|nr:hypothetical protein [Terriglobia bacterium]